MKDGSHRAVSLTWARRVATAEKLAMKRLAATSVDVVDEVRDAPGDRLHLIIGTF